MDVPHDSERGAVGPYDTHVDDRNCQDYSPAKRREILEQIGDQLMQAWAEECPDSLDEIRSVAEQVRALGQRLPVLGFGSRFSEERRDPFSQHSEHRGALYTSDPVEIPDRFGNVISAGQEIRHHDVPVNWDGPTNSPVEPDPGPYSLNTPVLDGSRYMVNEGYSPQSIAVSRTATTYTMSRPIVSTRPSATVNSPVYGNGSPMVEEESLHGRVWVPISQSTPKPTVEHYPANGAAGNVVGDHMPWRLVCEDRPSGERVVHGQSVMDRYAQPVMYPHSGSRIQSGESGRSGTCENVPVQEMGQITEFEDWVTQLEPLLRHTFEAGVRKGQGGSNLVSIPTVSENHRGSGMIGSQRDGQMRSDPALSQVPVSAGAKVVKWGNAQFAEGQRSHHGLVGSANPAELPGDHSSDACDQENNRNVELNSSHPQNRNLVAKPDFQLPSGAGGKAHGGRIKKVAKYDGKSCWSDYLVQFNIAAKLNGWDDSQRAMELATSLDGSARSVLADLTPEQQLDFQVLQDKLTQRFEPEGQLGIYQAQLQSRKRKRNETIPELMQEISRLVRKAYPAADEQTRSYMAVSSFITSLANDAQELFVYQKEPKNLDEAGRAALSFETFKAARAKEVPVVRMQQAEPGSVEAPRWARDWMTKIEKMEKQLSNWTQRMGRSRGANSNSQRSGNRRSGTCHHCGQEGHWVRECPTRGENEPNRSQPSEQTVNTLSTSAAVGQVTPQPESGNE